ncbi:MAG: peptide deformylase [Pirellulales bacterium]
MEVILFPHPTLRYKSKPIRRVDKALNDIVREMFRLMYEHRGVGLAANQVNLPFRLFVANEMGNPDEGEELVFINPVISRGKGIDESEEGCLSIPGVNRQVKRNKSIHVNAYSLDGKEINQTVEGFLAKIIQHETDHLDGVLFIDRLGDGVLRSIETELSNLEIDFRSKQRVGGLPSDEDLIRSLGEWEEKYC